MGHRLAASWKLGLTLTILVALAIAALVWWPGSAGPEAVPEVGARLAVYEALTGDAQGFARALEPRPFVFPADHGPHPEFRTKWWYFTGNRKSPWSSKATRA